MEPRQPEISIKDWGTIGKDTKRTSDGVSYTTLHVYEAEEEEKTIAGPAKSARGPGTSIVPGTEDRKLPEPKKTAAGSAVFGIRSLKASHK